MPLLLFGKGVRPVNLGTRKGFATVAATVAEALGSSYRGQGKSLWKEIALPNKEEKALVKAARRAMEHSYAPYSGVQVGAALLSSDGRIFTGCNIENAAYTPTVCAERTALFKAVSEGVRSFRMLAVCGGKSGVLSGVFPPCGVCRQVLREFCSPDLPVLLVQGESPDPAESSLEFERTTLGELFPRSFGSEFLSE